MFEEIFLPGTAEKYRAAPLAEERARYLRDLKVIGASRATLHKYANDHLNLVRHLSLNEHDRVGLSEVEVVAKIWSRPKGRRCARAATDKARQRFVSHCVELLRYLGWNEDPDGEPGPHQVKLKVYEDWLRNVRGLSEETIDGYSRGARQFLARLEETGAKLGALVIADIDRIIGERQKHGAWSRRTIHHFAQRLRLFVGFAETRGWCRPGLSAGIVAPGFMADEAVPKGIHRNDVERLLGSIQGTRPVDRRDRAILMLFVSYGLRASEVAALRLDDIDWENELLRVRCSKPGRTQLWPLSVEVGSAILDYVRDGRPSCFGRSLFFTSCAPVRPVSRKTLGKIVRDRLVGIGVVTGRRGPHSLRHAAAQHLLDQGMAMKVIGDFLGHRDPSSTAIYAKVDLAALREVAALDLEALS